MTFTLPDLPYDFSALEPNIDTRTMAVHHDKHHGGYVNNLNKALEGYDELQEKSALELIANLDDVPEKFALQCATTVEDMSIIPCSGQA
jgi:Fe-Mn family superoxide dismutase